MNQYTVVLTGEVREVYVVDAESEQEARANWADGDYMFSEAFGMEVESVTLDGE